MKDITFEKGDEFTIKRYNTGESKLTIVICKKRLFLVTDFFELWDDAPTEINSRNYITVDEVIRAIGTKEPKEITSVKYGKTLDKLLRKDIQDFKAGDVFQKEDIILKILLTWDNQYVLSGNRGDMNTLYSDTPCSEQEMLVKLNNMEAVKISE